MTTTVAMFLRNLLLLSILEPHSIPTAAVPLFGMTLTAFAFALHTQKKTPSFISGSPELAVTSPLSVFRVLRFGVYFVAIKAAGTLGERHLGSWGVLVISFCGGLVSSASATAAAANLASQGKISATLAGFATILTCVSSAFVNLPIVYQSTKDRALTISLALATAACITAGILLMLAVH